MRAGERNDKALAASDRKPKENPLGDGGTEGTTVFTFDSDTAACGEGDTDTVWISATLLDRGVLLSESSARDSSDSDETTSTGISL